MNVERSFNWVSGTVSTRQNDDKVVNVVDHDWTWMLSVEAPILWDLPDAELTADVGLEAFDLAVDVGLRAGLSIQDQ